MTQVVLIGDSIRMGYQQTARAELSDVAEVWGPEENGAHTANVLVHLHLWVLRRRPDLVHINAGLHDLKTICYEGRENVVPLAHYRENVAAILRTVRERCPAAKLIWALTTPVNERKARAAHERARDFCRYEADVAAYNQAAAEVAGELGVPVNNLFSVVVDAGQERIQQPDGVHFTPEGYALLGRAAAQAIRAQLKPLAH